MPISFTYAYYGKGWTKELSTTDLACPGFRVAINLFNTSGASLTVDYMSISVSKSTPTGNPLNPWVITYIYNSEQINVSSFTTPCLPQGATGELFSIFISTKKTGYDSLESRLFSHSAPLVNVKIQRNLYVARNDEPINNSHVFPIGAVVTSNTVTPQAYVKAKPGNIITQIQYSLWKFLSDPPICTGSSFPNAAEGTFSLPPCTLQGENVYYWDMQVYDNEINTYDYAYNQGFSYDLTAPTTSCKVTADTGNKYYISLNSSDANSGIDYTSGDVDVQASTDGIFDTEPWTNIGLPNGGNTASGFVFIGSPNTIYRFRFRIKDMAGVQSAYSQCEWGNKVSGVVQIDASSNLCTSGSVLYSDPVSLTLTKQLAPFTSKTTSANGGIYQFSAVPYP